MSFSFKQLYFGMFELFVMPGQIKKILTGQVYKRISGQLKENMHECEQWAAKKLLELQT
ncbi:hypothetical protein Q4108_14265 [Acinetobacter baumannii]